MRINASPSRSTFGTASGSAGSFGGVALGAESEDEKAPGNYGQFAPSRRGGHGVGLMAHRGGGGPIELGATGDKHRHGVDRDGHPINAAHISTRALFYDTQERDAPIAFEAE